MTYTFFLPRPLGREWGFATLKQALDKQCIGAYDLVHCHTLDNTLGYVVRVTVDTDVDIGHVLENLDEIVSALTPDPYDDLDDLLDEELS